MCKTKSYQKKIMHVVLKKNKVEIYDKINPENISLIS